MAHGADYRDTGVELSTTNQQANGLRVVCSVRSLPPDIIADPTSPSGVRLQAQYIPELYLPYDDWTEEELALDVAYRTMIEKKVAARVGAYQNSPERQAKKVSEALDAENRVAAANLEAARIEAENIVRRAEAEQFDRDLATMRAASIVAVVAEKAP